MRRIVLYSKPGCHLCEGLQEKLEQLGSLDLDLDIRNINLNPKWFQSFQYEVPVLQFVHPKTNVEMMIPRPSPRLSVSQLERYLLKWFASVES